MTIHFTDQNFQSEVLDSQGLVVVDFWASWCGPCQMMGPIIEQLAESYKDNSQVKVGKLSVEENQQTASKYQVMSIPTIIFFKNGQAVEQLVGVQSLEALKSKIDSLL
ncbi:MAG: thioredoxin [Patescibacteria group bacterium]